MQNKVKKGGNVPNLRFPGFEGEWEVKMLGDISEKINSGKTPLGGEAVYSDNGVFFIRSQNVNKDKLDLENPVFIPENINKTMLNSIVKPNDILLNITGASLGRSCVVPSEFEIGNVNQHVCIIRLNEKYNPRFIQPIFSSNKGQKMFISLQTGSGREGLNFENIKGIKYYLPRLIEQNKIAAFLSLMEKRIQTQNKIIEKLESSIKVLINKIFNQELSFKDKNGNNYPQWESKKIASISEKKSSSISANKIEDNHGEYILYGASGILKSVDFYEEENDYISIVKDGAGVGRLFYCKGKSSVLGTIDIIKPSVNINSYFLFYLLNTINFTKYITGSTIPHIYYRDYKNEICNIPSATEEQLNIANILSRLDKKIENEKEILKKYRSQKKYLLQNMFM